MRNFKVQMMFLLVVMTGNFALAFSGQVTKVDARGYGFITPRGGGTPVFFHKSEVFGRDVRFIREGICVEYHLSGSGSDLKAIAVKIDDYNDCAY